MIRRTADASRLFPRRVHALSLAACVFLAGLGVASFGQENPPPPSGAAAKPPAAAPAPSPINFRERPRYPMDTQRLKRRPTIDGIIAENEWDPLYTIGDQAVKGTIFVNWDNDYLYVAARTDQAAWFVFSVDANADGWLRGADNLEITVAPAPMGDASPTVTTRLLDASGTKDAPTWNERVVDPKSIQVVQKLTPNGQIIEMAIPKGIAGIMPRPNGVLSCRGDFLPASVPPVAPPPYEPRLLVDVTLVESRATAASGVTPRLTLEDSKLIPGQTLKASLDLLNQIDGVGKVKSVTWQGEAAAADLLKSLRDPNIPALQGQKSLKVRYSSTLPETTTPGFYQLTAKAELDSGKTVVSTVSFTVVEPFALQIVPEVDPVTLLGPTKIKINVEITSAVPGAARGDVEIDAPGGWVVQGRRKKEFEIPREDSTLRAPFFLTLPSSTQAGEYILNATITWHGKTWKVKRTIKVLRTAEPSAPKTETPQEH